MKRLADSCLPGRLADLMPLPAFANAAAEHPAQQKSMQDASPDRARYEEITDEKSPDGLLVIILLIFSFGLISVADDADNSGLKGFVEGGLNLLYFILSDQPPALFL